MERNLLNVLFPCTPLLLFICFSFSFSQLKFTQFFLLNFIFFAKLAIYNLDNAQIEKALKSKIFPKFNDKTRTHMRLFIMSIYLACCEFLCFICRDLNMFITGCCFRAPWRCDMICHIYTALPFYFPQISDSKAHRGLWSCNQEFLFKRRDELFRG